MTTEKSKLIERILENYALGRISRAQMVAMIEAVERHKATFENDADMKQKNTLGGNTMSNTNNTTEWKSSEKRPGYIYRTTKRGDTTVNVYKPILTPEGQAEREQAKMDKATRPIGPVMKSGAWK